MKWNKIQCIEIECNIIEKSKQHELKRKKWKKLKKMELND